MRVTNAIAALRFFLAPVVASLLLITPARAEYTLTELTMPGAAMMWLFDINNVGTMVGSSGQSGSGSISITSGYVYDGGTFTVLSGPAGSISNHAMGISDGGVIVGNYHNTTTTDPSGNVFLGQAHGFIFSGGTYTTLDVPGADGTYPRGISPDGRYVAGYYRDGRDGRNRGFVYDAALSSFVTVSSPDSSQIILQGINSAGLVAGSGVFSFGPARRPGVLYDSAANTLTEQSIAGATQTRFRSIDDSGVIAGFFADATGSLHGFVGSVTNYEQLDFVGAEDTVVQGSNNAGVLVGNWSISDAVHAFIATPIAEPGTLLQQLHDKVTGPPRVGPGKSLGDKVALAQVYYEAGDCQATHAVLDGFINQIIALLRAKKQRGATAALITDAEAIKTAIPCPAE